MTIHASPRRLTLIRALWLATFVVLAAAGWRLARIEWTYRSPSAPLRIEDRREHRFRDLTWSQAEAVLNRLLRQAYAAREPRERALALARVASLQRERGLDAAANAAAREALQLSRNDPEVRAILTRTLRSEELGLRAAEGQR
ncbi:MAG: hypothetical protein JSW67_15405 [Candidatus Latescibacterota bacterium]|nr:MAG: hypothetical protein JSW67_15405 [Candidatus Latescibacterota bacterium]